MEEGRAGGKTHGVGIPEAATTVEGAFSASGFWLLADRRKAYHGEGIDTELRNGVYSLPCALSRTWVCSL